LYIFFRLRPLSIKVERNTLSDLIKRSPRRPPFICPICHIQHNTFERLGVHLRRHTGERPFSCLCCEKVFASDLELSRHMRRMHRDGNLQARTMGSENGLSSISANSKKIKKKRYSCSFCAKLYLSAKDLNAHIISHVGQESFECDTCEIEFSTHIKLLNHKLTMHPSTMELVKCRQCSKTFPSKEQMRSHATEAHKFVSHFKCKVCKASFTDVATLKAHRRQHIMTKKTIVPMEMNSSAILMGTNGNSNSSHDDEDSLSTTSSSSEKVRAIKSSPERTEGFATYSCSHCNMGFGKKTSLKLHMHVHFKEKNFHCTSCSSKFQTENQLSFHVKTTHNPNKDFACELCENRFSHKGALVRHFSLCHKDTDIGVSRFICKFCKLEFPTRKEHNVHFTVHDGEKKFSCLQCGRRFHRSDYLKKHILTHTGERPFKCDQCPKGFNRKDNLKKHIIKNHKGIEQ